ncbi:restriction endonuclease subunit S [Faecalibacterium sp.]|jgi:type I restriction enzyme S subunit|uniref:restriction endonuclease subunit S n=1 Tax=Faecalibacterium sp. TaxID=1971605 RepID=UPI00399A90EB
MIQLKDLCQKASSNIAQKDLEGHEGQYPIYGASGLIGYVDFYKQENPYVAVVKDGAGIGRVMCLPEKSSVIGTMQYILPNEGVNVHYLAFAMEHMNLAKYFSGATIPHIYFKDYCTERLPKNSEAEQKQISTTLSRVTELISLRKQQLSKLDELVKARFVEMFGTYPKNENGFPVAVISDVANVSVGVVIKPAQYYVTEECGIKAFRSLNIGEMYIKDSDWVYFSTEGNESNKKSQLHENDLLIVRSGAPGTSCVVTKEFEGCNAVDVIIAHPNLSKVNPWYLCAYINYPHGKKQIEEGTGGAAQQHFNVGKCNNLKVLLPPLEPQNQFAAFVERVNQQKQTVQQSLEKLELMKKALMQEYFG